MSRCADQYRPLFAQLGERVKGHRKALGLSLEEVGNRAGLTKSYVWEIERGSSKNPTVAAVWGLASALGVSPETLLGLRTDKPTLSPFAIKIATMIDAQMKGRSS